MTRYFEEFTDLDSVKTAYIARPNPFLLFPRKRKTLHAAGSAMKARKLLLALARQDTEKKAST